MKIKNFNTVKALFIMMGIVAMSIAVTSCQKNETVLDNTIPSGNVQTGQTTRSDDGNVTLTQYGFLKFKNRAVYDDQLSSIKDLSDEGLTSWESALGFTSLRTSVNEGTSLPTNLNSSCEESILLTILNNDGLIQIGNYVYKMEYDSKLCWTMSAEYLSTDYNNFKNAEFDANKMNRLNFNIEEERDIDFIEYVESGVVGIYQNKTRGIFGKDCKYVDDVVSGGTTWRADYQASYQAAAFYKSLMTELKYMAGGPVFWSQKKTNIEFYKGNYGVTPFIPSMARYKPKGYSSFVGAYPPTATVNDNKLTWRPYSGSTRLNDYNIDIRYRYNDVFNITRDLYVGVKNY